MPFQKVKSAKSLKDRIVKNPKDHMRKPIVMAESVRDRFNCSIIHATDGSSKLIAEVMAAKVSRIKNKAPNARPPLISAKANGKVRNINPGPSVGVRLLSKTMGKITNPAKRAIKVSQNIIVTVVLTMDSLLGK